jgi:UDP:flavonoid glycosyltransferase YjiC (YdhE family)
MRRALFFPSYFGNGFGHVARCLAIADEMSSRKWAVAMVLSGPHATSVRAAGYKVFKPLFPKTPRTSNSVQADYTYIRDGNMQVLRDGFVHPWKVLAAIAEAGHFVRRFRPDVLVGDMSLLTWLLGQRTGLPVVQVLQAIVHPSAHDIIWWEDVPEVIISPDICPVFDPVLNRMNIRPISRAEELLQGDRFLIPSIPEIDPLPEHVHSTYYVGALLQRPADAQVSPFPHTRALPKPVIYVTHGGGRGRYSDMRFFKLVNEGLGNMPWSVILSTGRSVSPRDLPRFAPNISCYQWLPNGEVIPRSDVVVFHGGYTTMMESVRYGVPGVVIPSQSEQEGNGRRLEALSAACLLRPSSPELSRLVRSRWRYGEFTTLMQQDSIISPQMLRSAVESVVRENEYTVASKKLSAIAKGYSGSVAAVDVIDALLS